MAGNSGGTAAYDPRQIWTMNLAPLVVAAREGTAQAARTMSRERARARQRPAWWRQRWVMFTAAGVAVAGAAGGAYAAMANRRSGSQGAGPADDAYRHRADGTAAGRTGPDGMRSTMETGRAKVSGVARNAVHKLRGSERANLGPESPRTQEPAGATADDSRNQWRQTGTGYRTQS